MKWKYLEHKIWMLLVGNYQLTDWNSLYIFKGITSSSTEV